MSRRVMMSCYVQTENIIANNPILSRWKIKVTFPVMLWNANCVLKGPFEFEIKYVRGSRT